MNVFGGIDVEDRTGTVPLLIPVGTIVEVYRDASGTDAVTSFLDVGGSPSSVLYVAANSRLPEFTLPVPDDTLTVLYARVNGAPLTKIRSYVEGA